MGVRVVDREMERLYRELEDLQTRYAFQEDTLHALNDAVVAQRGEIDRLEKQYRELRRVLDEMVADIEQLRPGERPPHY